MQLTLNRLEKKYSVQEIEIEDDNLILMVELFVRDHLSDEGQESFYAELEGKAITEESVKDALYRAILSNQVAVAVKKVQAFYAADTSKKSFIQSEANKALRAIIDDDKRMNE